MRQPCTVPDCQSPAVVKGLCVKHYMRLRRHGDPAKVNRPGRKDKDAPVRAQLSDISDRTYARFMRATRLLRGIGEDAQPVLARCIRPNGSVNYALFEQLAEGMAAMAAVERYKAPSDEA
jgi:hypothetical protein